MTVAVYVLSRIRSLEFAARFLDRMLPERKASAEEYGYPQYSNPPLWVSKDWRDVVRKLEQEPHQDYSLYWDHIKAAGRVEPVCFKAMLWFTSDGGMIAGCDMFETAVMEGLRSAAATVEASFGYVTGEEPPPDTVGEFLTICRTADLRLVDGSVVDSMSE